MLFTDSVLAQKKQNIVMQWNMATELPAENGVQHSLGFAGPVTGTINKVLIVAGGANFPDAMPWDGGKKKYYSEGYVYNRKQGQLVLIEKGFTLPATVAYAASCTTPKGIFYAGGENENGISDQVWLMQWSDNEQQIIFTQLPSLPLPVTNASATVIGHTVYLAGGETPSAAVAQFICLDLDNSEKGWKQLASVPHAVSHTILISSSGKKSDAIYLSGGRKKNTSGISDFYADVFKYDVAKNSWEVKASLPYSLSAGTGVLYKKKCIIIFGGDKGVVFHQTELLIAAINNEKDESKKQELILQKNKLQLTHPGFSNEVLLYNTKTNDWQPIGTIPFATPVTTTAVKWKNEFIIPSGEIKAGVRSPKILSVKILTNAK